MSANRPLRIVEVEDRRDRDDIHVGIVKGFQRSHVAPVERFFFVLIYKIEGVDAVIVHHLGQNIFAEVVAGIGILGIFQQHRDEDVGVEDVNSHGAGNLCGIVGRTDIGLLRLFEEASDTAVAVDFHHTETV